MSNILCTVERVQIGSLPHCLRHHAPANALGDAVKLTTMLEQFFSMGCFVEDAAIDSSVFPGLCLVFDLLRDKIEIGMGDYKFPSCGIGDDKPGLVEREVSLL